MTPAQQRNFMKFKIIIPPLLVLLVAILTGCQAIDENNKKIKRNTYSIRRIQQNDAEKMKILRHQLANAKETAKIYEEQMLKLNGRLDTMEDRYSDLARIVNELRKMLGHKSQESQLLEKELGGLRNQLAAEKKARRDEMNQMIDRMSKETATAINKISEAQRKSNRSRRNKRKGPIGKGEFFEYVVQKGATLSAIAKAYKVRVSEIRRANGLNNNVIYVGQKLYIPKK